MAWFAMESSTEPTPHDEENRPSRGQELDALRYGWAAQASVVTQFAVAVAPLGGAAAFDNEHSAWWDEPAVTEDHTRHCPCFPRLDQLSAQRGVALSEVETRSTSAKNLPYH